MKKVNLNDMPWRERKSPKGIIYHYPESDKWGFSLEHLGTFRIRQVNYFDGGE